MLRPATLADVDAFFDHQDDPAAAALAAFPIRDRAAHDAHWARILTDPTVTSFAIVHDGEVVGNIGAFTMDGERQLGYWIGREHWGRGIASAGVADFLGAVPDRPLFAHVAEHNAPSIRVLEKSGFVRVGEVRYEDDPVVEILYRVG